MILLSNINKDFGTKTILDDANLAIYDGEKVGIIGKNGQGKTTLLNIISGDDVDFGGSAKVDGKIAYLKQASFTDFDALASVLTQTLSAADKSQRLLRQLSVMNFNGNFDDLSTLSCGEKTKLSFALAFVENPQILLLDEPTNHLDLTGRKVIAEIVNNFSGTVLTVSHDVDFLNETCNKIVKVENGKLFEFYGNYDSYVQEYEKQQLSIKREYEKHTRTVKETQENIDKIKRFAEKAERDIGKQGGSSSDARLMTTKTSAMRHAKKLNSAVVSRISRLERILNDAPEKPTVERAIKYKFDVNPLKAKVVAKFTDVTFAYPQKPIFENLNFEIQNGQRVGIIGDNGCGKSTLIKLLLKKLTPQSGDIFTPQSLRPAWMEQDVYDLDGETTINELARGGDNAYRSIYLTNIINMNIDKSRFDTKIKNLSLGERMRIKLNNVILSDANFIILDEPTNHLDIENKEFLQKVLAEFKGSLLIVSHDLNFVRATCDVIYLNKNKTLTVTQ